MDQIDINTALDQMPTAVTTVSVTLVIVGLVLWLLGQRMARQVIAVSGLVVGGLLAFPISQQLDSGAQMTLTWVIGGSVAGCLLAWLLFRLWMGLSMALFLAMLVPAVSIVWQGGPTPDLSNPNTPPAQSEPAADPSASPGAPGAPGAPAASLTTPAPDSAAPDTLAPDEPAKPSGLKSAEDLKLDLTPEQREKIEAAKKTVFDTVRKVYDAYRDQVAGWWEDLGATNRKQVAGAASVGGLVGLLIGLVFPSFSAAFESALIGSMLLLAGSRGILIAYSPVSSGWLPTGARAVLLTLGLITLLGVFVQWTFWRRRADK